jgi:hypothetical protein
LVGSLNAVDISREAKPARRPTRSERVLNIQRSRAEYSTFWCHDVHRRRVMVRDLERLSQAVWYFGPKSLKTRRPALNSPLRAFGRNSMSVTLDGHVYAHHAGERLGQCWCRVQRLLQPVWMPWPGNGLQPQRLRCRRGRELPCAIPGLLRSMAARGSITQARICPPSKCEL